MKLNEDRMNDDINLLISEAKIRRKMTDEDIGKAISLKKTSLRNSRNKHTLPNMAFWKIVAIAKLAGYDVIFSKRE